MPTGHNTFCRHREVSDRVTMTDPATIAARNRQLIRETIAGYAAAAEVIEQERIERLRQITDEESRADYAMP